MNQQKIAILIIILFFLGFSLFGINNYLNYGKVNNTQDFEFHWNRINGIDENPSYPSLYHLIFSVFSFSPLIFYLANLIIIAVVIPLLLYKLVENYWVVVIYFFGISLPHQLIYSATYPQALILVYFLFYLLHRRNFLVWVCLTILAGLTHSVGLYLFVGILILEFLERIIIYKSIIMFPAVGFLKTGTLNTFKEFLKLIFIQIPLPIIFFSLKKIEGIFYPGMIAGSVLLSIIDSRASSIAALIFIIFCSQRIPELNNKIKLGFILFLCIQLIFYLLEFGWGTWKFIVFN